jgi:DNA-binding response OmpR family regulator
MTKQTRILFVDDEDSLRILVKSQLTLEGFAVDTADDGDNAIRTLKEKQYDLALLDIRMPRMNGIEVLRYVRQHYPLMRVIMLTAVDDLSVAIEAVKNGANDYLTKPYETDNLVANIRRVLAK